MTMPIRFSPMTTNRGMLPLMVIQPIISRRLRCPANPKQRPEGVERVEAAIEPERELIEVGLKVLRRDAVMNALQPAFQVAENQMNDRQVIFRHLRVSTLDNRKMLIAPTGQRRISRPRIRDNQRCCRINASVDEPTQRFLGSVRHDLQPESPRHPSATPLLRFALGIGFAFSDFDSGDDESLIVVASANATRRPANPRFVNLDVAALIPADASGLWPNHPRTQLMQDLERRFVSGKPELALKLHCRHPWRHRRNEIGTPKPNRQWRMRPLHHGSGSQADIFQAGTAPQNARFVGKTVGFAHHAAVWAGEASVPANTLKIRSASGIVRKELLKLRQRPREWKRSPLKNIGSHNFTLSGGREIARLPYPFDQNSEPWATHTFLYSHPLAGFDFVSPVNTDEHGDGADFARMLNEHSHINERQKNQQRPTMARQGTPKIREAIKVAAIHAVARVFGSRKGFQFMR